MTNNAGNLHSLTRQFSGILHLKHQFILIYFERLSACLIHTKSHPVGATARTAALENDWLNELTLLAFITENSSLEPLLEQIHNDLS